MSVQIDIQLADDGSESIEEPPPRSSLRDWAQAAWQGDTKGKKSERNSTSSPDIEGASNKLGHSSPSVASSGSCSSNEKDPSKDQNNAQVSMLLPAQAASLLSLPVNRLEEEEKKEEVGLLKKGSLTTMHMQWCSCLLGVFLCTVYPVLVW